MDLKLLKLMDGALPRMNPDICNGVSQVQLKDVESHIHSILRCASESFPPGLRYEGFKRCTPYEQYREITRPPKPRNSFELSQSDVYLVKYNFSFCPDGDERNRATLKPRYIFLPFVSDGGLIVLNGTTYKVTPVIGGKVFNIEKGRIFMSTPRTPMVFAKTVSSFVLNNRVSHSNVVYSPLYNMEESKRSKNKSTLVHYMLAEYGLQGLLEQMFQVSVIVGNSELDPLVNQGGWYVYKSRQIPPTGARGINKYSPTEIRIAISADQWVPILDSVLGAIFYILDNSPSGGIEPDDLQHPDLWVRLLPSFIFKDNESLQMRYEEMLTHIDSVKKTMDPITMHSLADIDIQCDSIFDLFKFLTINFQDMIMHHDVGSMYDQELTTTKHLCYSIIYNIFILMFELKRLSGDRVNAVKITQIMDSVLRKDRIYTVKGHGELTTDSIATDCKPFNATCNLISQSKAASAGKTSRRAKIETDEAMLLHQSQVEVSTTLMASKADPTGRSKGNPFVQFRKNFYIAPRKEISEEIENLKNLIKRD